MRQWNGADAVDRFEELVALSAEVVRLRLRHGRLEPLTDAIGPATGGVARPTDASAAARPSSRVRSCGTILPWERRWERALLAGLGIAWLCSVLLPLTCADGRLGRLGGGGGSPYKRGTGRSNPTVSNLGSSGDDRFVDAGLLGVESLDVVSGESPGQEALAAVATRGGL